MSLLRCTEPHASINHLVELVFYFFGPSDGERNTPYMFYAVHGCRVKLYHE